MSGNNIKSKKKMSVLKLIKKNNIPYGYIKVNSYWKKGEWKCIKTDPPKMQDGTSTWKSSDLSTYQKLNKCPKKYPKLFQYPNKFENPNNKTVIPNIFMTYKTSWEHPVLDVDDIEKFEKIVNENPDLKARLEKCVLYKSRFKRFPHYRNFVITDNNNLGYDFKNDKKKRLIKLKDKNGDLYGEMLLGANDSWVRHGERLITEPSDETITIDLSEIHFEKPNHKAKKKTKQTKIKKEKKKKETTQGQASNDESDESFEFDLSPAKRGEAGYKPKAREKDIGRKQLNDLLDCIDVKYWDDYNYWWKIGIILKGIDYDFNKKYCFGLWFNHSQRSTNNSDWEEMEAEWEAMDIIKYQDINIGTLHKYAQDGAPFKYNNYCNKYNITKIKINKGKEYWCDKKCNALIHKCNDPLDYKKDELMDYLNQHFCLVKANSEIRYVCINIHKKDGGEMIFRKNKSAFIDYMAEHQITLKVNNKDKTIPLLKFWLENKRRRLYYTMDFEPCLNLNEKPYEYMGKNHLNCFTGWRHNFNPKHKINYEKIEPIIKHAKEIVFNGDEKAFIFFHKCVRMILRGGKPNVAHFFWSREYGTGKNYWIDFIAKGLLGEDYWCLQNRLEDFTTGFNAIIRNKIIITLDELNTFNDKNQNLYADYKRFITSKKIAMEQKGKDVIMMHNFTNIFATSQYPNPIYIRDAGERRSAVYGVSGRYGKGKEGSAEYHRNMTTIMGINDHLSPVELEPHIKTQNEYFHYILLDPIFDYEKGWDAETDIPMTKSRHNIIKKYTPKIIIFICNWLNYCKKEKIKKVNITELYGYYVRYCKSKNYIYKESTVNDFSRSLGCENNNNNITCELENFKPRQNGRRYLSVPIECIDIYIQNMQSKYCFDFDVDFKDIILQNYCLIDTDNSESESEEVDDDLE